MASTINNRGHTPLPLLYCTQGVVMHGIKPLNPPAPFLAPFIHAHYSDSDKICSDPGSSYKEQRLMLALSVFSIST